MQVSSKKVKGRIPAHEFYDVKASPPALAGSECSACGTEFFPPLVIGCEVCGSAVLRDVTIAGRGCLQFLATVHLHHGADIAAPFTVGEIVLDDDP